MTGRQPSLVIGRNLGDFHGREAKQVTICTPLIDEIWNLIVNDATLVDGPFTMNF